MVITKLTEMDRDWVSNLFELCKEDLGSDFDKAWKEGVFYGIAYKGFIRLKFGKENQVCELAVSPAHRNKGIARTLLNYAISPCLVATHKTNIAANKLYSSCGFLHQGDVLGDNGNILNLYVKW